DRCYLNRRIKLSWSLFILFFKVQSRRVDAISLSRGLRSVIKHMSQMGAAGFAQDFGSCPEPGAIGFVLDGIFAFVAERLIKTRPTRTRFIFGFGFEKWR